MTKDETRRMAKIEWFKSGLQHHETLTSAVVAFEHALLRGALVLNGGAMIAMLALYGAVQQKPPVYLPLITWTIGLTLCAAAALFAALSQWQFQKVAGRGYQRLAKQFFDLEVPGRSLESSSNKCAGEILRLLAWVLWVGAVAAFAVGSFVAASQLSPT